MDLLVVIGALLRWAWVRNLPFRIVHLASVVLVAALVLAINLAPAPGMGATTLGMAGVALAALIAFAIRQRHAANPLYDLHVARRRVFWVAACAGVIVFGSLMGAMFVGQQFLQNVLRYSTLESGAAILPGLIVWYLNTAEVKAAFAAGGSGPA